MQNEGSIKFKKQFIYDDGPCTYEGHGKLIMHGKGKLDFNDGYIYEGKWRNGKIVGKGTLYFPEYEDCKIYHGYMTRDFHCDKKGKMIFRNGDIYDGEWYEGFRQGMGKFTFSNGDIYEGNFRRDKIYGHGTISFKYGLVKSITGFWKDEENLDEFVDSKFVYNKKMLHFNKELRMEIQTFNIFPNFIHKYIPVLGKETKQLELQYCLQKKFLI